ncbi:MAG: GGDEF domain-containing protein [Treponema sp.]|nr:GGDEF domain-containing protein [Treponema sp.]
MKNIAVFAQSLTVDYALEVIRGITSFFDDKDDVRLFLTQTKFPKIEEGIFEYQYWAGAELLKSKQIDAIIIISGSYASYLSAEMLKSLFKSFSTKPIISISLDLEYENSVFTTISCDDVYCDIVRHLKLVHNCKKIAFMSANLSKSNEARDRFSAYKKALLVNAFEFDESLVMEGNFTSSSAKEAFRAKYSSKAQIDFDAIIAANDLMALGCISVLSELGVKIPEEVKVIGFDDTYHSRLTNPTISTVAQQIYKQGTKAAELAYDMICGKKPARSNFVDLFPKFRQSCGCIELGSKREAFINLKGELCQEEADTYVEKYQRHFDEIYTIYTLFDTIHTAGDLENFYSSLRHLVGQMDMTSMYIYMYSSPFICRREEIPAIPKQACLLMYSDLISGRESFNQNSFYNDIEDNLLSDEISEEKGTFLLSPIFSGTLQYGYIICKVKKTDFEVYNIYLKILSNIIVNSYEFTKTYNKNQSLEVENKNLVMSNSDLDLRSKTDELTGILNRRGFLELGQETIDMSVKMNRSGIVFFADMDGLKSINDTYGHDMGDRAIKVQSEVLRNALRSTDILGRLSGDEFAFITDGMKLSLVKNFKKKVDDLCKNLSKSYALPFDISISIGAAVYSKKNCQLMELLIAADKKLYTEKKKKKSCRNQTEKQTSRL